MGKKETAKKLTLTDLLARKTQGTADKLSYKDVYVEQLGGSITLKKIPLNQMLDMMDSVADDASLKDSLAYEAELIYECCPMLHDKGLLDAYECVEPTDIVFRLLNDDIGAIGALSAEVLDFYGMGDSVREQLKNS